MSMGTPVTIVDAAAAMKTGETTAEKLVLSAVRAADALDDALGVFITRYSEDALERAQRVDALIGAGKPVGSLAGIPLGVKDVFADSSGPTTAQSQVLDPHWGTATVDAAVVGRLKSSDAIVMGKVTTMEFAIGNPDPAKPFPVPALAWDTERWAGGSSSGSASGVAAEMFLGAVGTDTAGSIRVPAAFNGITGLKPTFGLVPKSGVVPLGFTNDHPGPMARSAADCALLLSVMAGYDSADPYSVQRPCVDYSDALTGDLSGFRVGVDRLERAANGGIDPAQPKLFDAALAEIQAAGAELVDVEVPYFRQGAAANIIIMLSEALAYHHNDLRTRWGDYGQATRLIITSVDGLSGADYVQAQRVRQVVREQIALLFDKVDLIVSPTAHLSAPKLAELSLLDPFDAYKSIHTAYWSALGIPTLSVPIGLSGVQVPLALSFSAPWWRDDLVLRAGDAYQRRTAFHLDRSPLLGILDDGSAA